MKKTVQVLWSRYFSREVEVEVPDDFNKLSFIERDQVLRNLVCDPVPSDDEFEQPELVDVYEE